MHSNRWVGQEEVQDRVEMMVWVALILYKSKEGYHKLVILVRGYLCFSRIKKRIITIKHPQVTNFLFCHKQLEPEGPSPLVTQALTFIKCKVTIGLKVSHRLQPKIMKTTFRTSFANSFKIKSSQITCTLIRDKTLSTLA